jgi:transmembrane sensor
METREDIEQAAAAWIAKRDTGPWTAADAVALDAWLASSVSHRAAYYRLNAAWLEAGRLQALGAAPVPAAKPTTRRALVRRLAIAASVLVVVIAALFAIRTQLSHTDRYTTVVGGLAAVPMSDGSRVTLNTDSELRISLDARERLIELDHGEAFFEVAHDPARPFIVKVGGKRIVAVGTQFAVRRDGEHVRVTVSEGMVRFETDARAGSAPLSAQSASPPLLLGAGTIARAQSDAVLVQKTGATEIEQSLTWRTGVLTFRDTPLAEAVAEFNRYNTRKIVIEDPAIAAVEVGGIFRSTNLDPFVRLLEEAFPIRADAEGDRIVLRSTARN